MQRTFSPPDSGSDPGLKVIAKSSTDMNALVFSGGMVNNVQGACKHAEPLETRLQTRHANVENSSCVNKGVDLEQRPVDDHEVAYCKDSKRVVEITSRAYPWNGSNLQRNEEYGLLQA